MAYLILENSGPGPMPGERLHAGGYFDFDPANGSDVESIRKMLAERYAGNGNGANVILLSASSADASRGKTGTFRALLDRFKIGRKKPQGRRDRTVRPVLKTTLKPRRFPGRTTDLAIS